MKKLIITVLSLALALCLLAGCGTGAKPAGDDANIVIGASVSPHAEILEAAKPFLEAKGYTLEIIEYTDYVQPNVALDSGDLDANYFQHLPYLENFNRMNNMELVSVGGVHYEPMGVFPGKTASLDALADGAQIGVPNDGTNEGRALWLLDTVGLITLREDAGFECTILDIIDNPKNLEIIEMEAAQIPHALDSLDLGVINGNYALNAGLNVVEHALAKEEVDSPAAQTYHNIVAVRPENAKDAKIKALMEVLQSEDIKAFIDSKYSGAVFQKIVVVD